MLLLLLLLRLLNERNVPFIFFSGLHTMFYLSSQVYKWRE